MAKRTPETVDAWRSYHCATDYSVSICDSDGEIICVGGADDADEAFVLACSHADELGVPAQLIPSESGEVTRKYVPE
jgi:heptaprenylglyceryl phosphate synthase